MTAAGILNHQSAVSRSLIAHGFFRWQLPCGDPAASLCGRVRSIGLPFGEPSSPPLHLAHGQSGEHSRSGPSTLLTHDRDGSAVCCMYRFFRFFRRVNRAKSCGGCGQQNLRRNGDLCFQYTTKIVFVERRRDRHGRPCCQKIGQT